MTEREAMARAIELAQKGTGFVSPNPRVGAVILKNGELISEGYHKKFGGPHAEVEAIKNAKGVDLEGATIVVNLEPCSHFGKTPPCCDLIIEKKFSKVVIGMKDPNPIVAGKGIKKLRKAGIEVVSGVFEKEAKWLNRTFIKHITAGMPYVVLKVAQSIDGKIATVSGESQWITCEESRQEGHKLRAELDAVLVGKNTVLKDNPQLTVRLKSVYQVNKVRKVRKVYKERNPFRVVLDTNLSLPLIKNVFIDENNNKTIVCCSEKSADSDKAKKLIKLGVNILAIKTGKNKKIDLQDCLNKLSEQFQIASVLVEGGAEIHSSFIKQNLVDEIRFFIAPKIIGKGISAFDRLELKKLSDASEFEIKEVCRSGEDLHLTLIK
ncbi:MAG: bifunctional diaminohydroxyphosphoribosylaminopyrimidine deaminase/5-amino-6-(5-phosphoribosylamino)uracil reductase RibD [bacterium]